MRLYRAGTSGGSHSGRRRHHHPCQVRVQLHRHRLPHHEGHGLLGEERQDFADRAAEVIDLQAANDRLICRMLSAVSSAVHAVSVSGMWGSRIGGAGLKD